jgi:hypothetical protein
MGRSHLKNYEIADEAGPEGPGQTFHRKMTRTGFPAPAFAQCLAGLGDEAFIARFSELANKIVRQRPAALK